MNKRLAAPCDPRPLAPLLLALFLLFGQAPARAADQPAPVYHGNSYSLIYHREGCRYFDCKACVAVFKSKDEAAKAGFRPCKVCRP